MATATASLLTIFGATGDLARRMLLPALYRLEVEGLLPPRLRILGTACSDIDDPGFRALVSEAVCSKPEIATPDARALEALLSRMEYRQAMLDDPGDLATLAAGMRERRDGGPVVAHLSTPPRWYAAVCDALGSHGLGDDGTRVMLEKPIGHDLASATAINDGVARVFDESRVYRVDHYLGKEGVQNLLALRFGNALFEPLWNARHVEQVQITVAETVGVEGRGDYYDGAGALRDMVQNHLLQLLCLVAMESPPRFDADAVRDEKLKVLRSLRPIGHGEAVRETVAGQYAPGAINGQAVPGYLDELGRQGRTETFVALRAHVDNWRWSGVPFYLRTGKRMPRRSTEVYLQFRNVPHSIFDTAAAQLQPNALLLKLQPEEGIVLQLMHKTPGLDRGGVTLSRVALDLDTEAEFAAHRRHLAYERLYLDALEGNGTLFVRRDETEAAWRWIDGIHAAWDQAGVVPKPYPAGTWGPGSAVTLTERHGHQWRE